jgi:hypothetical protein
MLPMVKDLAWIFVVVDSAFSVNRLAESRRTAFFRWWKRFARAALYGAQTFDVQPKSLERPERAGRLTRMDVREDEVQGGDR